MSKKPFIFPENEFIFGQLTDRFELFKRSPEKIYPWWLRPCKVRLLLLTDGALDFGPGDFGLSTFVSILKNDGRSYVEFDITIAHRSGAPGNPGVPVTRSISSFRFNNAAHFTDNMYDEVWLFGFENSAGGRLSDPELRILSAFMNNGGGVFATGDHGAIGQSLCGSVTRVRSMRRWDNSTGEVGMSDPRRNDTNQPGRDIGSQFDDQSDDIPQPIKPRLYSSNLSVFWRETYPHPILCSPTGRITVLPDHPHEGECIEPADLTQTYIDGTPEYPMGIAPEIIAYSTVLPGNTAGNSKQATQSHSFGAICAYDGHRAHVGRVVTDATWHHFVNVNLVGELGDIDGNRGTTEDPSKRFGFLASASGQQHFAQIKHYYLNIAVWIARPSNHRCFSTRLLWQLVFQHRVLEATMDHPGLPFERISPTLLYSIGTHAMDVLGRKASQCRRLILQLEILHVLAPEFERFIDPWIPNPKPEPEPPLPWLDHNPLVNMAMGAGLLALRDQYGDREKPPSGKREDAIFDVFLKGAEKGFQVGIKSFNRDLKKYFTFK